MKTPYPPLPSSHCSLLVGHRTGLHLHLRGNIIGRYWKMKFREVKDGTNDRNSINRAMKLFKKCPKTNPKPRAVAYVWSEEMAIQLFMVINAWQTSHGSSEFINWNEVCNILRGNTGADIENSVTKNKFDNEKKTWKLWNSFRYTLGDALIDPVQRRVVADERWWASKIKQNFQFRNFKKGIPDQHLSILMDEVYHRISACHADPFAPINPPESDNHEVIQPEPSNYVIPVPQLNPIPPPNPSPTPTPRDILFRRRAEPASNHGVIRGSSTSNPSFNATNDVLFDQYEAINNQLRTERHVDVELTRYRPPPQFTRLELGSGSGGSGGAEPSRRKGKSPAAEMSIDSKEYKQFKKIRNMYSQRIESFKKRGDAMLDALESELFSSSGTGSMRDEQGFKSALVIINDMVLQNMIVEGSPLWCFAVSFIRNVDNRTTFILVGDHALRMTWLEFEFNRATQFEHLTYYFTKSQTYASLTLCY